MKSREYLIYTTEGATIAPNDEVQIENCQLLGRAIGEDLSEAVDNMFEEQKWLKLAGFNPDECFGAQIITNNQKEDLKELLDFLCTEHFEESGFVDEHIFKIIERLRKILD